MPDLTEVAMACEPRADSMNATKKARALVLRGGGSGASTLGSKQPLAPDAAALQWQDPEAIFTSLDADASGAIEWEELATAIGKAGYASEVASKLIGEVDANADGKITRAEWREAFYSSSFLLAPHPSGETFEDLHHGKAGCTIAKTEERAMTVTQLQDVRAHITRRCKAEGWVNFTSKPLKAEKKDGVYPRAVNTVTLYDAARYVIKPATYAKQSAFVELVAMGAQPPKWFCSHWWGEPVAEFVACVETHARDHGYSIDGCKLKDPVTKEVLEVRARTALLPQTPRALLPNTPCPPRPSDGVVAAALAGVV